MRSNLANLITFQALWFACVLGAAHGQDLLGAVAVAASLPLHLWLVADRRGEMTVIAVAVAVGFAVDSSLVLIGAVEFPRGPVMLLTQPLWMAALWVNFAMTLRHCLRWVVSRPALAVTLGALGGPLAYGVGDHLGALSLAGSPMLSLMAIAPLWAVAMGLLSTLTRMTTFREMEVV